MPKEKLQKKGHHENQPQFDFCAQASPISISQTEVRTFRGQPAHKSR